MHPWKLPHPLKIHAWKLTFPFETIPFVGTCVSFEGVHHYQNPSPGRWSSAQTLPNRTPVRYHCWMQRQRRERHLLLPSTLVIFVEWEKKRWWRMVVLVDGIWWYVFGSYCGCVGSVSLWFFCWRLLKSFFKGLLNMWKFWWFLDVFVYFELPEPCFFCCRKKCTCHPSKNDENPPQYPGGNGSYRSYRSPEWPGKVPQWLGVHVPDLKISRRWAPY